MGSPSASTWGAALFVDYAFDAKSKLAGFSLPVQVEYITSDGSLAARGNPEPGLWPGQQRLVGDRLPTYRFKIYFVRAEFSFVDASGITPGFAFGAFAANRHQARGLLETGVLF